MFSGSQFSIETNDATTNLYLKAVCGIVMLPSRDPTEENINDFHQLNQILLTCCEEKPDLKEGIFKMLNRLFLEKSHHPVWKVLIANSIFNLYTTTIPSSGLPLTDPHIATCIEWATRITELPHLDQPNDNGAKIGAYRWLYGIYTRRGTSDAASKNLPADLSHPLIQKGMEYHAKEIELMLTSVSHLMYNDISSELSHYIAKCKEFLPSDSTLQDLGMQQLIDALEKSIAFESDVPADKRTMTTYVGPAHMLIELDLASGQIDAEEAKRRNQEMNKSQPPTHMWDMHEARSAKSNAQSAILALAMLYAKTPKNKKENTPDYMQAAIWFGVAQECNARFTDEAKALFESNEIKSAFQMINDQLEPTLNELSALTDRYIEAHKVSDEKQALFIDLKKMLGNEDQSKLDRVFTFRRKLMAMDKNLITHHRTNAAVRYIANAASVLTIFPAIVRACVSFSKFRTFQFWKPESQKMLEYADKCSKRLGSQ